MQHYEVDKSSNVASTGWHAGVMEVKFKDGSIYEYGDARNPVPQGKHIDLMQAPSKGEYLHKEIKGKYPHKKKPPKKL